MAQVPRIERKNDATLDDLPQSDLYRHSYKHMWVAYVINLVGFGVLGGHRFYLLYYRSACIQLGLFFAYILLSFVVPILSDAAMIGLVVWVLVDLFLIPGMTRARNATIAADIDAQIEEMRRSGGV